MLEGKSLFPGGFPGDSVGKASPHNTGDLVSIPGSGKIPWRSNGNAPTVFLSGKSHGRRSLVGYSACGREESDTTEAMEHARACPYVTDEKEERQRV